jgi:hypothetical protein
VIEPMQLDHRPISVTPEDIEHQRQNGWTDFGPEDFCHNCGGRNPASWCVDSDRWNAAFPDGHPLRGAIVCPGCFVAAHHAATGLSTTWRLTRDPLVEFRHWQPEEPNDG